MTIKPNFFIVGAPKSGTTALCDYLRGHPNIFISKVKEPHFFDSDTSGRVKLSLPTYLSLFSAADPTIYTSVGEASTGYLFSKSAVSEILRFNPEARFIVMVRNPVDLVQSWHSQMFFEGVEDVQKFETAWRLEPERRVGRSIPHSCWEVKKLFYSEWGKLGDQVERLFSAAGRNRVKIIVFDDFVADTGRVYEEVLAFLGVHSDRRMSFPRVNENRTLKLALLQQQLAWIANYFRLLRSMSGLKLGLGLGLFSKALALNSTRGLKKPISPALQAELVEFYREDVQKLSGLLGRDLSSWFVEMRTEMNRR